MKIKVDPTPFAPASRDIKIQISEKGKWIDFGSMNYIERAELAEQLRRMANELLRV